MKTLLVRCTLCGKHFPRRTGQINEAKKFGWNQFCSVLCMGMSKVTGKELKCANAECNKIVYRPQKEIKKSAQSFCSHSCSAKVSNKVRVALLPKNYCIYASCGAQIPRYQKYCSQLHANRARQIPIDVQKRETIATIIDFYKQHKRIPVKREMYGLYKEARAAFGNWNNAIKAAGFEPNPVMFANRYVANDGHECDSFTEKIIDDWLYTKSISHQRRLNYPGSKLLSVDFVVGNKWIEFFGLAGELKDYDKLVQRKRVICRKNKIKLVEIYPKDLFPARKREQFLTRIFS